MTALIDKEICPTYEILDHLASGRTVGAASLKGHSIRNLIGQAHLRQVGSRFLRDLIQHNNLTAMAERKPQFVVLLNGRDADPDYVNQITQLQGKMNWSELQERNLDLNLQLIQMEEARRENTPDANDDDLFE